MKKKVIISILGLVALILIIGIGFGFWVIKTDRDCQVDNLNTVRSEVQELTTKVNKLQNSFNVKEQIQENKNSSSEDKKIAVSILIKKTNKPLIPTGIDDAENNELWIKYSDGSEELLVASKGAEDMQDVIANIHDAQFSIDKSKIYFMTSAWVTSNAIHVVDIKTKKEKFVCDGNSLEVVKDGPYRGKLIVNQHRYYGAPNYGSYDHDYVVDDEGKEIKDLGGED